MNVSYPKVEKVLRPPQMPVNTKSLIGEEASPLDSIKLTVSAKIRQAVTFEIKVETGRLKFVF